MTTSIKNPYTFERFTILLSLFFFAFAVGLIADGKKLHTKQVRISQQVDFRSTLNPFVTTVLKN